MNLMTLSNLFCIFLVRRYASLYYYVTASMSVYLSVTLWSTEGLVCRECF